MTDARLNDSVPLVHAYLDGELDTAATLALEQRMAEEPALAAERARFELAVLASGTTWAVLHPQRGGEIADAVVSAHVRALMAPQSSDVLSSDRHTVKPWFNGRIPQAPRVVDLSSQDFTLVGGRIDVVERVPVPSLLYQRRQHLISLTAIPKTSAASASPRRSVDGYNIVGWNDDDVSYWATSDLNVKELQEFAAAFRAAP